MQRHTECIKGALTVSEINTQSPEADGESKEDPPGIFSLVVRSIVLAGVIGTASWWFVGYAVAQVSGVLNPILSSL